MAEITRKELILALAALPLQPPRGQNFCGRLAGVDLSGLDLSGLRLMHLDMSRANLRGCNLSYTDAEGCNLDYADLSDTTCTHFFASDALFTKTKFVNAKLIEASGDAGNFEQADFTGAELRGCWFYGARFGFADFTKATAIGCKFDGSWFYKNRWRRFRTTDCEWKDLETVRGKKLLLPFLSNGRGSRKVVRHAKTK